MSAWDTWRGRLGTVLGTVVLSVFVPVAAWASSGTGEIVVRAVGDPRRRKAGFGGLECCVIVVFGIALLVVLLIRLARRRPPE